MNTLDLDRQMKEAQIRKINAETDYKLAEAHARLDEAAAKLSEANARKNLLNTVALSIMISIALTVIAKII